MPKNALDRIMKAVAARLEASTPPANLEDAALAAVEARREDGLRSLSKALRSPGPSIIAECKHASPSAGVLREPFDPVVLASEYQAAGAAAISVVTEVDFFLGDPAWIPAVRSTVSLPVLRKDFIFCQRQLYETAILGADAVLLIQRVLDRQTLAELLSLARKLELEVLLELFADEDPEPSVSSGAEIIGINARDLATFETDLDRIIELCAIIPPDRVRVAESGIHNRDDLRRLEQAGFSAFLIGEHLVRSDDPSFSLQRLLS